MNRTSFALPKIGGLLLGVAGLATAVIAVAGPAEAATPFAAQTHSAGLSASQTQTLQREVNSYVVQTHGRQVSANRVDFAGGYVLVPTPGQQFATDLAAPAAVHPDAYSNCLSGDFCAYSGSGGTGSVKAYYICQDANPFSSGSGSVYNHQTGGAQAKLYRYRGTSGGTTYLALTLNAGQTASWSWTGSADIRTC